VLEVSQLEVAYGSVLALRRVSLEVRAGEIVAVIGPNGAGKSTLLLSIAGVVAAKGGDIRFAGVSVRGLAPERLVAKGISLVPEGRRIFGSLSVAENVRLGATVRADRAAVAADIEHVLSLFPVLRERYDQRAGKLSGGEQQMLAIARALTARPQLLLLDEPSLGLAPLVVAQVYDTLGALRRQGVTILVVEQNAHRALAAADRTYVLNAGTVALGGRSAELQGAAAFEAAYFGLSGRRSQP
jgi:branched-chain amino acid transport system ATP-binding protein